MFQSNCYDSPTTYFPINKLFKIILMPFLVPQKSNCIDILIKILFKKQTWSRILKGSLRHNLVQILEAIVL